LIGEHKLLLQTLSLLFLTVGLAPVVLRPCLSNHRQCTRTCFRWPISL